MELILFGDDGSTRADVAWLWINSHAWRGVHLEVLTAEPPRVIVAREDPPPTTSWTPTHPRSALAQAVRRTELPSRPTVEPAVIDPPSHNGPHHCLPRCGGVVLLRRDVE